MAAAAAVAAGLGAALLVARLRPGVPVPEPAPVPPSSFEGVEVTGRDPDGSQWRLVAERGSAREGEASGELLGVRGWFHKGGRVVDVDAGRARVAEGRTIDLDRGVRIGWEGYEARVGSARYDRDTGTVSSSDPVELEGPGLRVQGVGIRVNVAGRRVRVGGPVEARVGGSGP